MIGRNIADQITKRRERFGITYAFLSRQLTERGRPIPPLGLRRIEAYERRIDIDDLVAIAAVLDLDPVDMLAVATGRL